MNLTDLGVYIDHNKPQDFVNVYLTCLAQGFSLACPTDATKEKLIDKWSKILAKYRRDFSDEFCQEIALIWLKLLSSCDTSAPDIEHQLFKAAGISTDSLNTVTIKPNQKQTPKTAKSDIPAPAGIPKDPLTKPEISASYRERQLAEAVSFPEVERLSNVYQKVFKSSDADQFLITHLTFAKYNQPKDVPKSTVPQNIREAWESIIANEFNTIANDDFLMTLTNEWFYLVNQKGIPMNPQDQEEILMTFLAKKKQPKKTITTEKPSLFKKLFGR